MARPKHPLQSPKPMRTSVLSFLVLLAGASSCATAADQDLGARLTNHYRNQILALRHAFTVRSQEYDSQGNPLTGGSEGSWTLFGRINVTNVSVGADHMQVEGDQVIFASDKKGSSLKPSRQHERVKINIRLDHPLASEDEAVAILARVFALTTQDVVDSAPSLWQSYLAKQLKVQPSAKPVDQRPSDQEKLIDDQEIFKLGKDVVAPKPLDTPEPEFTPFARKQRFEGTLTLDVVVDSRGNVNKVAILRPLGMGLDEAAAAKVSGWRFAPAMHDGHPVAVAFYIEVEFHLYDR